MNMNSKNLLCLLLLLASVLALPAADLPNHEQDTVQHQAGVSHLIQETAAVSNSGNLTVKERATNCALFLCIRDGSTTNSVYPWLINNKNARFSYVRTDDEGYSSYSYQRIYNGQTLLYYLHFYDEGLFYNGFWVVNDLETGYVETRAEFSSTTQKTTSALRTLLTTGTSGKEETGNTTQTFIWRHVENVFVFFIMQKQ